MRVSRSGDDSTFAPPEVVVAPSNVETSPVVAESVYDDEQPRDDDQPRAAPRAGTMSPGWRLASFVGFGLAVAALGAVWAVATQIGHTTWWMGPAGSPHLLLIQLLPFYLPFLVILSIILNRRWVSWFGTIAGAVEIAIGAIDLAWYVNLGLLEIAIGVLMIGVAVASLSGVLKARRPAGSDGTVVESGR